MGHPNRRMDGHMKRPVIGVSGPDHGGFIPWAFAWLAIRRAGGYAVRLTPNRKPPAVELHGLVIGGGADIAPELYGGEKLLREEMKRSTRRGWFSLLFKLAISLLIFGLRWLFGLKRAPDRDPGRDRLELDLLEEATEKGFPVLGICRGMQLINVFYGGTLHQEVDQFYGETGHPHTAWPYKWIALKPGTTLQDIFDTTRLKVNALHHQAVNKLGRGIETVGIDSAGVIQAVEHRDKPFVLGVQWHPELLPQIPIQKRIFYALIAAARRAMP